MKEIISNNGDVTINTETETSTIGCQSGSGCSASTSETHTTSGVTYNADGSTHTYNTVDTETAQVGCQGKRTKIYSKTTKHLYEYDRK